MPGKKIGYIRVSSFEQNTERQLDGIKLDKCFIDKASGKDTNRPQLNELLSYVREDDTIFVHSMDRLARNLDDLRDIVKNLTAKNITINFIRGNVGEHPKVQHYINVLTFVSTKVGCSQKFQDIGKKSLLRFSTL